LVRADFANKLICGIALTLSGSPYVIEGEVVFREIFSSSKRNCGL
jgi:hypothetical protein